MMKKYLRIILIYLSAIHLSPEPAAAIEISTLLRCHPKDAIRLSDDGTLVRDATANAYTLPFIVDISTGVIRVIGVSQDYHWKIVQHGSASMDAVLVLSTDNPADASTNFIRIRQWSSSPRAVYLQYNLSSVITGTCERVE